MKSLPLRAFYFVNIMVLPEYTVSYAHCVIKMSENLAVFEEVLETAASSFFPCWRTVVVT
jgi:hypothetical protein